MIELSRHIESLLLEHDCVIIPNFGGFVTHHIPAHFVEEEQLYLPPMRGVGFNAMLQMNDGVLIQSVMLAEDASYPEAMRLVAEFVDEMKQTLAQKGEYLFNNIGRLTYSLDGRYHFTPNEAGVLTPEHYALDTFTLQEWHKGQTLDTTINITTSTEERVQSKKKTYTVNIQREWLSYGIAILLAIALYFAWAVPTSSKLESTPHKASIFTEDLFRSIATSKLNSNDIHSKSIEVVLQTSTISSTDTTNNTSGKVPTTMIKTNEEKESYTLVLASAITQTNAEALAKHLQKKGYSEVNVWKRRKMVRVVYGNFTSETEARTQLNKLRQQTEFTNAWVMERK